MKTILANRQKWNKRGVELTINFIVTLILALAAFALGAVIIRTLTAGGTDSITLTQDQLNDKISQLSCSSRDKICISNNNKVITPGDFVVSGLAVFNYLNSNVVLNAVVEPKRAYSKDGSPIDIGTFSLGADAKMPHPLFSSSPLEVNSKTQGQLAIGIVTYKETPKGTYLFKVTVSEDGSSSSGFATISDEISITIK